MGSPCSKCASATTIKPKAAAAAACDPDEQDSVGCGICHDVLTDACQMSCCGAQACRACLKTALFGLGPAATVDKTVPGNRCPWCNNDGRHVHCGPDEKGEYCRFVFHPAAERMAANVRQACPHPGCGLELKRDALKHHAGRCGKRPVQDVVADLDAANAEIVALRADVGALRASAASADLASLTALHAAGAAAQAERLGRFAEAPTAAKREQLRTLIESHGARAHTLDAPRAGDNRISSLASGAPHLLPADTMMLRLRARPRDVYFQHAHPEAPAAEYWVMKAGAPPRSAKRITIPAQGAAVVVAGMLTAAEGARPVTFFIARTRGALGLSLEP